MRGPIVPVLVLLASMSAAACATSGALPRPYPGRPPAPTAPPSADAGAVPDSAAARASVDPATAAPAEEAAVDAAEALLGAPYRSGGTAPDGFDCSGFVQYVYARAGIALPRSVREQWQVGVPVDRAEIRRGDLVFFAMGSEAASHVGIALDTDTFVHAPSARGVVRVERLSADYWSRRYAGARRVSETLASIDGAHGR